jgi:hypothetical protein
MYFVIFSPMFGIAISSQHIKLMVQRNDRILYSVVFFMILLNLQTIQTLRLLFLKYQLHFFCYGKSKGLTFVG